MLTGGAGPGDLELVAPTEAAGRSHWLIAEEYGREDHVTAEFRPDRLEESAWQDRSAQITHGGRKDVVEHL